MTAARVVTPQTLQARPARRARLRRTDCSGPGLTRVRRGRGFSYLDPDGDPVRDPEELLRVKELVIPPAWKDVWISPDPLGHLQATGIDAAGRRQYRYHDRWTERQAHRKFEHMLEFAEQLPRLRRRILKVLREGSEPDRERVLACAVRLLDVGLFRIGSDQYHESGHGVGLSTLGKAEVTLREDGIDFDYVGKAGQHQEQHVCDPAVDGVVRTLRRRRSGGDRLLAYRERRRWHDLHADQINDYLKAQIGADFSAKDFRTWNATMLAAVAVALDGREATTRAARKRAKDGAVRGVATVLGNTPAVARRSYIDPRVFDRYDSGWTIGGAVDQLGVTGPDDRKRARLERAVIDLLHDDRGSPAVTHDVGNRQLV